MIALDISRLEQATCWLAHNLSRWNWPALLFKGEMGAGKTTFTRYLVENLPGSENCEVSSPSFNICNLYPCEPPVFHCDLYRCRSNIPDDVEEELGKGGKLTIIEWAEFLPEKFYPQEFLDISIFIQQNIRLLEIAGFGITALAASQAFNEYLRTL